VGLGDQRAHVGAAEPLPCCGEYVDQPAGGTISTSPAVRPAKSTWAPWTHTSGRTGTPSRPAMAAHSMRSDLSGRSMG
jgi:hypothetical protein